MRTRQYNVFRWACSTSILLAVAGCGDGKPDPRTVRGALAAAAQAVEARDAARLFRVVDQRARHALASIVSSRAEAKRLIEADYPQNERAAALAALGDAATVSSAAELFALRCDAACLDGLAAQLGAPASEQRQGASVVVRTARGQTLHMHAGSDTWYGLVWNTDALIEERARAARETEQIRDNAALYARRRALAR
jgi:hypothetical protein